MASEKRLNRRFLSPRVQVRIPDRATLQAALRDVSEGGLYVETTSPPHVGETTRVELFPPGWPQPVVLSGTVVRAELTGYAVRLDPQNDKARAQLKALVAQVANEQTGPVAKSLPEAQQRLSAVEAELRDTKDKLNRVQADAEDNRAYLERALAQAGSQKRKGISTVVLVVVMVLSFGGGVVVATIASVARTPVPPPPRYDVAPAHAPTVRSMEGSGPKRPAPLPMAAIFSGEQTDGGAAGVDAGEVRPKRPGSKPLAAGPPPETGTLNFLATGPAEVMVDNKKLGPTPLRGKLFKVGSYRVQFVCEGGTASPPRQIEVLPFTDTDVEHRCE